MFFEAPDTARASIFSPAPARANWGSAWLRPPMVTSTGISRTCGGLMTAGRNYFSSPSEGDSLPAVSGQTDYAFTKRIFSQQCASRKRLCRSLSHRCERPQFQRAGILLRKAEYLLSSRNGPRRASSMFSPQTPARCKCPGLSGPFRATVSQPLVDLSRACADHPSLRLIALPGSIRIPSFMSLRVAAGSIPWIRPSCARTDPPCACRRSACRGKCSAVACAA